VRSRSVGGDLAATRKGVLALAALCAVAGFAVPAVTWLAGCGTVASEPLRIATNVWPPYELLYLARERGYLAAEGVDVELVDFSSYNGALAAYHQGQIDALMATLNEIQNHDNFLDPPIVVLVLDYSFGGDAVVARSGLDSLAALRGRRIAYEESALGSYVLERALGAGRLAPSDVIALNRLPEEAESEFRAGAVDAVVTYEPFLGRLVAGGGAKVLFSSRQIPGEIVDVLAVRPEVLRGRCEDLRRVARAWFRALADYQADPAGAAVIMAAHENVGADEVRRALDGSHVPDRRENLRLLGTSMANGGLVGIADRLGAFLVRRGLAREAARGDQVLSPAVVEAL
jgi:NitT/TauT family transport system substrate-binding protein